MRFSSGDDVLPFIKLLSTGALGLVFGGIAAAGTLKLAQLADRVVLDKRATQPELPAGHRAAPSVPHDRERSPQSRNME